MINIQDKQGNTPLMNLICYEKGNLSLDIASIMLECPFIDLSLCSKTGNNSLHLAASFGQPKIFAKCFNKAQAVDMKIIN